MLLEPVRPSRLARTAKMAEVEARSQSLDHNGESSYPGYGATGPRAGLGNPRCGRARRRARVLVHVYEAASAARDDMTRAGPLDAPAIDRRTSLIRGAPAHSSPWSSLPSPFTPPTPPLVSGYRKESESRHGCYLVGDARTVTTRTTSVTVLDLTRLPLLGVGPCGWTAPWSVSRSW